MDKSFTVNVEGKYILRAYVAGFHAYYAGGVTAIEVKAKTKHEARKIIHDLGCKVLYVFE